MEERRLEGARLLKEGKLTNAEIACQLDVTRGSVGVWEEKLKAGGVRQLRMRKSSGRPSKLTDESMSGYAHSAVNIITQQQNCLNSY